VVALSKTYTGPAVAAWRRWVLRYARTAAVLLMLVWLATLFASSMRLGKLPPAISHVPLMLLVLGVAAAVWAHFERQRLVRESPLPQFLKRKLRETYPHLSGKDAELVERGLRQFFLACLRSKGKFVAMPSRVVDTMWHEFILHTRAYRDWCELLLGRFIDHVPAEVLGSNANTNDGLRRAWYWACRDETINPKAPTRLPLLFALDAKLNIPNGFAYVPDCGDIRRSTDQGGAHCGESFSDGSYSGDADGFGGADSSGSDGGDGGDGGGGCGGD
jgi:hypothetical protein